MDLTVPMQSSFSYDDPQGFSADGSAIPEEGVLLSAGQTDEILFVPYSFSNMQCDVYYFVKIEVTEDVPSDVVEDSLSFTLISDDRSFITGCNSSFVDVINFDFENKTYTANDYHFRIRFYEDAARTNEYLVEFSGNNVEGWLVDNSKIPEDGVLIDERTEVEVVYRPNLEDFEGSKLYYLIIDAHMGSGYQLISNSYTFKVRDIESLVYCGEYMDVPIVKNFGFMVELNGNESILLNS